MKKTCKLTNWKFLLFMLFQIHLVGKAQEYSPMPLPGFQEINSNTGSVSVSIPIWTIEGRSLKVPIIASYASKGLNVNQAPGIIGTTWELVSGGFIVQEVVDGEDNMYTNNEPDIYYYNLPGQSGKFINRYGLFSLQKSNNKIIYDNNQHYTIIDDQGTSFFFSLFETNTYFVFSSDFNGSSRNISRKWLLTKMISANKKDTINFEYKTRTYSSGLILNYNEFKSLENNEFNNKEYFYHKFITDGYCLTKISAANCIAELKYNTANDALVRQINIYNYANELVKSFKLNYQYPAGRPFLNRLVELSSTGDSLTPYYFSYLDTADIPALPAQLEEDYGGFPSYKVDTSIQYQAGYGFPFIKARAGMLYEIYYPQGNFLHFDYEQNTYSMPVGSVWDDSRWRMVMRTYSSIMDTNNFQGPGVRVKSIMQGDGSNFYRTDFEYIDENGNSSGRSTDYPVFESTFEHRYVKDGQWYTSLCKSISSNLANLSSPEIFYERISIYHGGKQNGKGLNGKIVNQYLVEPSVVFPSNIPYAIRVSKDREHSLLKSSLVYDKNDLPKSISEYYYSIKNNYKYAQGLKKFYDKSCSYSVWQRDILLDSLIKTTYDDNQQPVGFVSQFIYEKRYDDQHADFYQVPSGPIDPEDSALFLSVKSIYPLVIRSYESTGKNIEKHVYYPSVNSVDPTYKNMAFSYNVKGLPVLEETYIDGLQVSGSKTLFSLDTGSKFLMPQSVSVFENGQYAPKIFYDQYNTKGMLVESHGTDGIHKSILYGYGNTVPVAEISNAPVSQVFYTSFEDTLINGIVTGDAKTGAKSFNGIFNKTMPGGNYLLSFWKKIGNKWEYIERNVSSGNITISEGQIDEVRIHPANAFMSTKTWKPLVGISSTCDVNNISAFNEYDDYGRIIKQMDQDKNEVNMFEYSQYPDFDDNDISITGIDSSIITCNQILTAQLTPTSNASVVWQWFDTYCNGNLLFTGASYNALVAYEQNGGIIPVNGDYLFSKTYFVRPVVNGKCLPCREKTIRYYRPSFSVNQVYEYNYQANSSINIPVSYSACEQNWSANKLNQATWLSLTKVNDKLSVILQQNTTSGTRSETINLNNPGNLSTATFTISQLAEFKLDLSTTLSDSARVYANITGGKAPYQIKWYVNNVLKPQTGTTLTLAKGQTYTVRCDVTDSYTGPQSVSKQISFAAYTPLVLTKTLNILNGIIDMKVYPSGGTPPYTYRWYKNGVLQSNQTYSYSGKYKTGDSFCCKVTDTTIPNLIEWICNIEVQSLIMQQTK